ncbi:MAG: hypothetical protein A2Y71_15850, partial [Bacteroidetes bacterium RBG_13_42_15]
MNIRKLVMGPLETNCYVITDEKTSRSIVIDPADENKDLKQLVEDSNTTVDKILLTHGHFDHIGGVNVIQRLTGAELWIHSLDEEMLRDPSKNISSFFENRIVCSEPSYHFKDDTLLECGSLQIKVIHTPGHTLGSSCFLIDGALFSGDTLFQMGIGRTD